MLINVLKIMKNLKQGYNKITNFVMLSSLLTSPMVNNLRLIQKDELKVLDTKHTKKVQLSITERNYIKTLYQNFVLNDFRFDDKVKPIKSKVDNQQIHIGLRMLNQML